MKRSFCFCLVFLIGFGATKASAQTAVGYDFLRTLVGARPSAMAGAFVGMVGDVHNMAYNPAGLAFINDKRGTVSYLNHLLDFNSGFLAFAQDFGGGSVGLALSFVDFGQFDRRNELDEKIGEFGSSGLSLSASYARFVFTNVSFGATGKYIRFGIDSFAANAVAADFGVNWRFPDLDLVFGLAVQNIGTTTSAFIQTKEDLPLNFQLGLSKRLAHLPVLLSGALIKYKDDSVNLRIGGEISFTEQLKVRIGYNTLGQDQKVDSGLDKIAGVSFGLGFQVNKFEIDYSLSSFGEVGSLNRFSLVGRL